MMRRLACALVAVTAMACGFSEARQQGEQVSEHYFDAAQRGDTASIFKMYDVTLVYDVEYESTRGTETIIVFIPSSSNTAGIRGHNFRSDALLQ